VLASLEPKMEANAAHCVIRLVIPTQKAGIIIGKGGANVKQLAEETTARVKIFECPDGYSERVLMVSAKEEENSVESPARTALLRVHDQLMATEDESTNPTMTTKLLMPNGQTGSLIGKNGSTIKSIQDQSGANIRVTEPPEAPPCALPDDRLVEISGVTSVVKVALELIVERLRKFAVDRSVLPQFETMKANFGLQQQQQQPQYLPQGYMQQPTAYQPAGVMVRSQQQMGGMQQGFAGYDQQGAYGAYGQQQQYNQYAPPSNTQQLVQPQQHYSQPPPQQQQQQRALPPSTGGYGAATYNPEPSYGGPVVTNGTVAAAPSGGASPAVSLQMRVPRSQLNGVLGRDNANLTQIRSMSGATVSIKASDSTAMEHIVEISGTSAQVQAAQALTTAFMLSPTQQQQVAQQSVGTTQSSNQYYSMGGGYTDSGSGGGNASAGSNYTGYSQVASTGYGAPGQGSGSMQQPPQQQQQYYGGYQ